MYMYKYIGNKWITGVFKFQVAVLLAWKMWVEQPTAILLSSSRNREILLLIKFGRMARRVAIASFLKWPREPTSKVSRLAENSYSFKVIYEGNVVWFSLFPFMSSLEAVLSVYRNSKLQKLDILSLDDDYVWSRSCRDQWDRHCQRGVFRGSVTWKVSIQGGLLRKMMLETSSRSPAEAASVQPQ